MMRARPARIATERETFVKTWRFVAILLVAIALGAALAHLMELPGKMTYDAQFYVYLHRTLYPTFGRTAGWAEAVALFAVAGLAWRVRKRGAALPLTLTAAVCQSVAMIVFLAFVLPANRAMGSWPLDAIPAEWTSWRNQWEYGHAARAVLMLTALAALVLSVVRETPVEIAPKITPPASPPAAVVETPRSGSQAVVTCETPREGLRVVYFPEPRKAPAPPPESG